MKLFIDIYYDKMTAKPKYVVNNLICKENKKPAYVLFNDVKTLVENFNKAFEKDMLESDVEKYVAKYCIEEPFEEITDSRKIQTNSKIKNKLVQIKTGSEVNLNDSITFSTQHQTALNKMLEKNNKDIVEPDDVEENENDNIWIAADDEWRNKTRSVIENYCKVDITLPDGFYDAIKRFYAIQGLKKKMPWMAVSKSTKGTTSKLVSERFKKGRRKESIRNATVQQEYDIIQDVLEPPPWEEMEKMRRKCIDWFEQNEKNKNK